VGVRQGAGGALRLPGGSRIGGGADYGARVEAHASRRRVAVFVFVFVPVVDEKRRLVVAQTE